MALVLADRVLQTGSANTTVSFNLTTAVSGYQSFAIIGNGNTTYYSAWDGTNWEVGIGTYSTTGPILTRTTIIVSSNSNAAVSTFGSVITIFVTQPAEKAVYLDINGNAFANSFTPGWTSTTTAAGTTTLTVASTYYQRFVGSTTQTLVLPDATTVSKGQGFIVDNDSTGSLALQTNGGGSLGSVVPGMAAFVFCEDNSTTVGSWSGYMFVPGGGPSGQVTWGTTGLSMGGQSLTNVTTIGAGSSTTLNLQANATTYATLGTTGVLTLTGASANVAPPLVISPSSIGATSFNWASSAISSGMPANSNFVHFIGQATTTNNSGYIGFNYASSGSNSNFVTIGLFGKDNILNITGNNYVGIGTTSPSSRLSVVGTAASGGGTVQTLLVDGNGGNAAFTINSAGTSNYAYQTFAQGGVGKWEFGATGDSNSNFYLNSTVQNGYNGAQFFIQRSNGFVGINNTSPGTRLQVNGAITAVTGASNNIYIGQDTGATNYNSISLNGSSGDSTNMGLTGGGTGDNVLYVNAPGNIQLRVGNFTNTVTIGNTYIGASTSYIDTSGPIYNRGDYNQLNATSTGWNTIIARNGGSAIANFSGQLNATGANTIYNYGATGNYNETFRAPRNSIGNYCCIALACDTSGAGSIAGQFNILVYPSTSSATYGGAGAFSIRANGTDAFGISTGGAVTFSSPWISYTPTIGGFASATLLSASYQQLGSTVNVTVKFTTGGGTGYMTLPSSPAVDMGGMWYYQGGTSAAPTDYGPVHFNTNGYMYMSGLDSNGQGPGYIFYITGFYHV